MANEEQPLENTEQLGEVHAPSGTLVIADESIVGAEPLDNIAVQIGDLPQNGPIPVTGERNNDKQSKSLWRDVFLDVQPGARKAWSESAGKVTVEGSGVLIADTKALSSWQHGASVDGKSDLVITGRDSKDVAASVGAEQLEEGFGWIDLPTEECEKKSKAVELIKSKNGREIQIECRPHSHHHQAVTGMRKSINGAAQIELGGSIMLALQTGLPEGEYPVFRDLDGNGKLVRVRIQLASEASKPAEPPAAEPEKAQAVEVIEGDEQEKIATKTGDESEPEGEDMAKKKATKKRAAKKTATKKKKGKSKKAATPRKARGARHTNEEKSALVDKYHKLITEGKAAATAAAKQVGISYQTLLKWEKELGKMLKKQRGRKASPKTSKKTKKTKKKTARKKAQRTPSTPRKARGAAEPSKTKELKKAFATPKKGAAVHASPSGGPISIVTPSGFRIEGLHTDDVIKVLDAVK